MGKQIRKSLDLRPGINTKDSITCGAAPKNKTVDGLIGFFHDPTNGFARLKLYDSGGKECLLLRLPLKDQTPPCHLHR